MSWAIFCEIHAILQKNFAIYFNPQAVGRDSAI